jgi:hypothetical protein
MKDKLTVVTCSMDREIYLAKQVSATKNLKNLHKHLIINWSSANELNPELLEVNPKVEIVNVKNEDSWWLSRAYNFGFSLVETSYLMKLDADTIIDELKFNSISFNDFDHIVFSQENQGYGNFLIKKTLLEEVNGFNEFIWGWGYDDIDLYKRLIDLPNYNHNKSFFDGTMINVLDHENLDRFKNSQKNINKDFKFIENLASAHSAVNKYTSENTSWDNSFPVSYKNVNKNNFYIRHFYSPKDLDFVTRLKRKHIFFNKLLNFFKFRKLFIYIILIIPNSFIKALFKVSLYPTNKKTYAI